MKLDSRIRKELMRRAGKDARAIRLFSAYISYFRDRSTVSFSASFKLFFGDDLTR